MPAIDAHLLLRARSLRLTQWSARCRRYDRIDPSTVAFAQKKTESSVLGTDNMTPDLDMHIFRSVLCTHPIGPFGKDRAGLWSRRVLCVCLQASKGSTIVDCIGMGDGAERASPPAPRPRTAHCHWPLFVCICSCLFTGAGPRHPHRRTVM